MELQPPKIYTLSDILEGDFKLVDAMVEATVAKLKEKGYEEELINDVIHTLYEGVDIKIAPAGCSIRIGELHVRCLNRKGEIATLENSEGEFLYVDDIDVQAVGIHPDMIKEIQFPALGYSKHELLELKVTVFPFPIKPWVSASEPHEQGVETNGQ